MAVLTKEQVMEVMKKYLGDNTTDEVLSDLADIKETFESFDSNITEEYEKKISDLKAENENLRIKFRDTFFGKKENLDELKPEETEETEETEDNVEKEITFEDLFEDEKEEK